MDKISIGRVKRRILKHVLLVRTFSVVGILAAMYVVFVLLGLILGRLGVFNYWSFVSDFVFTPSSKIQSIDGRVNILILGKSGPGHAGADLTDTMIFASVSLTKPSITLVSLPRDIWIAAIRAKLNSAYYWGNQKEKGGGITLSKSITEEIVGVPIQYAVVVDFSAFQKIIDVLGGINVDIERSFADEKYPIAGREDDSCQGDRQFRCRYETVHFEKGKMFMDGATALKFARSRNAEGDEGTDIAREARQEKIIAAVKENVLSSTTVLNPKKLLAIWGVVKESLETDISPSAFVILGRRGLGVRGKTKSSVLPSDFLVNPPISPRYDNQYVFVPKAGDWSQVQGWIKSILR